MSLKTHAETIKQGYINACNAVLNRGGEIENGANITALPDAIRNMSLDAGLAYQSVEGNHYRFTIPENAEPYARVDKIGGMTYQHNTTLDATKVTALKSEGENMITFPYKAGFKYTRNGITFEVGSDGSIVANGTATKASPFSLCSISVPPGTYHLSGCPASTPTGVQLYFTNNNYSIYKYDDGKGVTFTITSEEKFSISLNIPIDKTVENLKVYPMLVRGSAARPYKLYFSDTLLIPDEVQNLEGYGDGILHNSYEGQVDFRSYIDFDRKVFVQRAMRKVFDGTESWTMPHGTNANGITNFLWIAPQETRFNAALCSHLEADDNQFVNATREGFHFVNTAFYFRSTRCKTVEEWKSFLASLVEDPLEDPLEIVYGLIEPIEIDISEYLTDEFIKVEGGGTITALDTSHNDIPLTMTYLIETTGGAS